MAENSSNGASAPSAAPSDSGPSVRDILDFDPFEPSSGEATEGKAPGPSDDTAANVEGDALPPSSGEAASQQQPQNGAQAPDPVLRELARINETLAAAQQPQQQYTPQQAAPQGPRFNLEIPQQILKAVIHSEDPEERAAGLAALVNGLANTLYNDISSEVRQQQQHLYQALPQMHQRLNQEQVEQQRAASDFFGRFTNLQPTQQMMQFVAAEAKQLAVEQWRAGNRNLQWNDDFREALGYRIHAGLGLPFPQRAAPQQQQQPASRTPKRPQFAAGGDAKGSSGNSAPSQEAKEIWDVFGYS